LLQWLPAVFFLPASLGLFLNISEHIGKMKPLQHYIMAEYTPALHLAGCSPFVGNGSSASVDLQPNIESSRVFLKTSKTSSDFQPCLKWGPEANQQ
jgi:hypothetical protein